MCNNKARLSPEQSSAAPSDYKKQRMHVDKIDINTYEDLQLVIDDKTGDLQNLHLELENLNIQFDLHLVWIDSILRDKVVAEHNRSITEDRDKIFSYDKIISINFKNCKFKKLYCWNIPDNQILEINITSGSIEELNVNSKIQGKFYINKQYGENKEVIFIDKLIVKDSIFQENFKLHNAQVKILTIEDTDFNKHADFFKSKINKGTLVKDKKENINENDIGFKAINFKGLALFGDTEFGKKLIFKYVTFESFSHFRKSKLPYGLDLDYSNIQNEMNFFDVEKLDSEEAKSNTSQETYRIIKHNFEKIGNKIEANKYFALELEQKKVNLENDEPRKWLDYLVFKIHWLSSEFGTNWFRVLCLICFTSLATVGFIHFDILKQLFFHPNLFKPEYIMKIINEFFQYLYILNKNEALRLHPATLIFNKVALGYLYYQFLISIRKDTRK